MTDDMHDTTPEIPEPFTLSDLQEKRRYVESRSAREHWGAAELAHVDEMARWIATVDRLREHLPDQVHNEQAIRTLQAQLEEAQLRSIESRNPGIDMAEVRRQRSGFEYHDND